MSCEVCAGLPGCQGYVSILVSRMNDSYWGGHYQAASFGHLNITISYILGIPAFKNYANGWDFTEVSILLKIIFASFQVCPNVKWQLVKCWDAPQHQQCNRGNLATTPERTRFCFLSLHNITIFNNLSDFFVVFGLLPIHIVHLTQNLPPFCIYKYGLPLQTQKIVSSIIV